MADRTLNEISSATDFANAYTEDASGNQVKISKADMASVLAGVMDFPFEVRDRTSGNLNELTQMGIYRVAGTGFLNAPSSSLYGILLVLKDKSSYGVQVLFNSYVGTVYWRGFNWEDNNFYEWKQITTTDV